MKRSNKTMLCKYIKTILTEAPGNVLIWINSGLGNTVQAIPAILEIKRLRPELNIVVAGLKNNIDLIKSTSIADEFFVVPSDCSLLKYIFLHEPKLIKKYRYVFVFFSNSPAWLIYLKKVGLAKNIISVRCANNQRYRQDITVEYDPEQNEAKTNISMLAAAGIDGAEMRHAKLFLTEDELTDAKKWLESRNLYCRRLALIHPGWVNAQAVKGLPDKLVRDLLVQLAALYDKVALILGAVEKAMAVEKLGLNSCQNIEIISENFNMRMFAAILANASILISADTGPAHIASAVGTLCITCFGPTSAERCSASGYGTQVIITSKPEMKCLKCQEYAEQESCQNNRKCLENINVADIIDKLN